MSRVSRKDLHRLVYIANAILLWRGVADRQTGVGRVQVYAWGTPKRHEVQQVVTQGGGVRTLHPATSVREAFAFLSGFITSLRLSHPEAPLSGEEGGQS